MLRWIFALFLGLHAVHVSCLNWGPYVQEPAEGSIIVRYFTGSATPLTLTLEGGAIVKEDTSKQVTVFPGSEQKIRHEFLVTGLTGKVGYTLDGKTGYLQPRKAANAKFRVGIYGDTKSNINDTYHPATVKALLSADLDILLNAGDVTDDNCLPIYNDRFFEVEDALVRSVPMFPCEGNHDLMDSGDITKPSAGFREVWYMQQVTGLTLPDTYHVYGNLLIITLSYATDQSEDSVIKSVVAKARQDAIAKYPFIVFTAVVLHAGPVDPWNGLDKGWSLMNNSWFGQNGIDFIFSGDSHIYSRSKIIGGTVNIVDGMITDNEERTATDETVLPYTEKAYSGGSGPCAHVYCIMDIEGTKATFDCKSEGNQCDSACYCKRADGKGVEACPSSGVCGSSSCTPSCTGKACGASDGCNGTCRTGTCPSGQSCVSGKCRNNSTCTPSCSGKVCGASDGCAGICKTGSCPTGKSCNAAGKCQNSTCIPICSGKACGAPDGCNGTCQAGSCSSGTCVCGSCLNVGYLSLYDGWQQYGGGYSRSSTYGTCIKLSRANTTSRIKGAHHELSMGGQTTIAFGADCRTTTTVTGSKNNGFSIALELHYSDGTTQTVFRQIDVGLHDFLTYSSTFTPLKPISSAAIFLLLNTTHQGSAYFRNIYVRTDTSDSCLDGTLNTVDSLGDAVATVDTNIQEENEDNEPASNSGGGSNSSGSAFLIVILVVCAVALVAGLIGVAVYVLKKKVHAAVRNASNVAQGQGALPTPVV